MSMGEVAGRGVKAENEGDFVVFLIGARFNHKLQFARSLVDLGGKRGMKHMLDHLVAHPEKGLLAYEMGLPTIVQYWRSFEHLEAFARDAEDPHLEVWRQYWRRVGRSSRTGIWHETYLVQAGQYEAVYGNMPPRGLGKAGRLVPVSEASNPHPRLEPTETNGPARVGPRAQRVQRGGHHRLWGDILHRQFGGEVGIDEADVHPHDLRA